MSSHHISRLPRWAHVLIRTYVLVLPIWLGILYESIIRSRGKTILSMLALLLWGLLLVYQRRVMR